MSNALVDSYIDTLYEDAKLLRNMCGVYPGDPSGDMQLDATILEGMADALSSIDWDEAREQCRRKMPKVVVTVSET